MDIKHDPDPIAEQVIGAAVEVHRHLGPGLLESIYLAALAHELFARRIDFEYQVLLPVLYKGATLSPRLRLDLVVQGALVVELKAVDMLLPVHQAQLLTYLRLGGYSRGLLMNFNVTTLANGIQRCVN
jgi:GxxExxY protein